jgi:hypothetical protein
MVWILLIFLATAHAGGLEAAPHDYVDTIVDEVVHCLAGIFVSPFYALVYSIIYVLFELGHLEFSAVLSNFGSAWWKDI